MRSMRRITTHAVGALNEAVEIAVLDEPGDGGACHRYALIVGEHEIVLPFQNGPLGKDGENINGISIEALIAVCIDRMRGFQTGDFACRTNAIALTKLEESLMWLQNRTRDRVARGVEGTHEK